MGCGTSTSNNTANADAPAAVSRNLKVWNYQEVKQLSDAIVAGTETEAVLIDCRTADEVAESGTIPGAIVVPLDEMEAALQYTPERFESVYKAPKFRLDSEIVVYCLRGMRSQKATAILKEAGYTHVDNYPGSWIDWCEQTRKFNAAQRKPS